MSSRTSSKQRKASASKGVNSPSSSATLSETAFLDEQSEMAASSARRSEENAAATDFFRPLSLREIRQGEEIDWDTVFQKLKNRDQKTEKKRKREPDRVEEEDVHYEVAERISHFQFSEPTMKAIMGMGLLTMMPVQARAIRCLREGLDVMGHASKSDDMTLAFLIHAVELVYRRIFLPGDGTVVIILCSTQELAKITHATARDLMEHQFTIQTLGLVNGCKNRREEAEDLKNGVNILVATPARLLYHIQRTKGFIYKNLKYLIIDGADCMLKANFEDMKEIFKCLPQDRQTALFSDTLTEQVKDFAGLSFKNTPLDISVDDGRRKVLQQGFCLIPIDKRFLILHAFLSRSPSKKVVVFFSCNISVNFHSMLLQHLNFNCLAIEGVPSEGMRFTTLFDFCEAEKGILLCTNAAIHNTVIHGVDWIIQYDPPNMSTEYMLRVRQTAAMEGGKGHSMLFLLPEEQQFVSHLKDSNVHVEEYVYDKRSVPNVQSHLEKVVREDNDLKELAKVAYDSHILSYVSRSKENGFDVHQLNLKALLPSFCCSSPPEL